MTEGSASPALRGPGQGRAARVIAATADLCGLTRAGLLARSRATAVAWPRMVAMAVCRERTDLSLKQIGRAFGRDHTTVTNAVRRVCDRMDADLRAAMDEIAARAGLTGEAGT